MSESSYLDKPHLDGKPGGHPAYKRGQLQGTLALLSIIKSTVNGTDTGEGQFGSPQIEAARQAKAAAEKAAAEAKEKLTGEAGEGADGEWKQDGEWKEEGLGEAWNQEQQQQIGETWKVCAPSQASSRVSDVTGLRR